MRLISRLTTPLLPGYLLFTFILILSRMTAFAQFAPENELQAIDHLPGAKMMPAGKLSSAGFEENKGQVSGADAASVRYTYRSGGLSIFLLQTGIAYQFTKVHYPKGYPTAADPMNAATAKRMEALQGQIRTETYRMDLQLPGANPNARMRTEGRSADFVQYYNRNVLDVHSYAKVIYEDIYPNIDWVLYTEGDHVKYDFVVHPGGNPADIRLQGKHISDMQVAENGSLELNCRMGKIIEQSPISFQGGKRIATKFIVEEGLIHFDLEGYNRDATLIIDPSLAWATYYGNSGGEYGRNCVTDNSGMVYWCGSTESFSSIASGGYQNTYGGGTDALLVKFNSNGVRQWATYYGGNSYDAAYGSCVDNNGFIYIAGISSSGTNIAFNGHQNTYAGNQDEFLVKFSSSGVRQWATYYGGALSEFCGFGCITDNAGAVYIGGTTASTAGISSGGFQNTYGGGLYDAYLVKFSSAGVRQWATYYGGASDDAITNFATSNGFLYAVGETGSTAGIASGGHQNTYGGGTEDAFLVKFDTGGARIWATYYGGSGFDANPSCALSSTGNDVYLCGLTESATNMASGGFQNTLSGTRDGFLARFNAAGQRQWGTYYGGSNEDWATDCALDAGGSIFIAGMTRSANNIASLGVQNTAGGNMDSYLAKFNPAGARLWGTYFAGPDDETGWACATDNAGAVYLSGVTFSTSGMASGGHQNFLGGDCDGFLAKFTDCTPITATKNLTICANLLPYTWNGISVTSGGNGVAVYHTPSLVTGCDSATTLNLSLTPVITATKNLSICANLMPYTWNGITVTTGGNGVAVYHTPSLVTGCDSATTLNLSVNPVISATKTIIICPNMLPYTWNGITVTAGGNAVAVYHTPSLVTGCDSATTLNLIVNPSITATKNLTICANQLPYAWNGMSVTTGGNAVAVYHTPSVVNGCDSATSLNLTVNPLITATKNITICANQLPYVWNGFTLNTGGNAVAVYHTPSTATGCDSATTLNLTVNPLITATKNITICANQLPYVWNGFTLNAGGNAVAVYHTPSAATGCDSATTLNLTVNPLITATKNITICANQLPYVWNGFTLNTGGNAVAIYHTPSTATGCDSATTLNLTVNPLITATKNITICANQLPYVWNGFTLNAGGNAVAVYHTPSTATGCDSATTLNLTVNPLITATKNITICANQLPYAWNGFTLNAGGNAVAVYHTTSTATGCDSATTLNLTVNPLITATKNITICQNQLPYVWNGIMVTAGGNAVAVYHTPSTVTGCDSATTLNLIVNPVITATKNLSICSSQLPYIWNGFVLNSGGTAVAVYHTPSLITGCDSATTLNLTVLNSYTTTSAQTICNEDVPYVFGTQLLITSGTYTQVFTATSGCDSTVTLNLTVRPQAASFSATLAGCGSVTVSGNTYSANTILHDTLSNGAGCDSVYRTRNIIIYPNAATIETIDTGSCKPITIGGKDYASDATITDTLHSAMGCDSVIRIIHIFIEPLELNLSATPAEVFEGKAVLLETSANRQYEVDGWLPASWFPALHAKEQQWTASQDATIAVWGRSNHGCLDTATVNIDVVTMNHALFVPNAFSPNGDGNNDLFKAIFYINLGHRYNTFRIFNRFGQKVYEASMVEEAGWDGLYRGQPADLGTYSYFIEVEFEDGYKRVLKGNVALIR